MPSQPPVGESTAGALPAQPDPPRAVRLAALLAAVEGGALLVLALVLAVKTAVDHPDSYGRALAGVALAGTSSALMLRLAAGVLRLEGWSRAPLIVVQVLALPVGYTIGFGAGLPGYGVPILAATLAELGLLFTPQTRLAFYGR